MRESGKQGTPRKKTMNIKTITGYQKACWAWGKGSNIKNTGLCQNDRSFNSGICTFKVQDYR